jgi:hypothetical protein
MHIEYWWESHKKRAHWEDQDVGGWTTLKWILERQDGMGWIGLIWLMEQHGTCGIFLKTEENQENDRRTGEWQNLAARTLTSST